MAPSSIDRAVAVRDGEALAVEPLQAYLQAHLPNADDGVLTVEQFPSGFSNLTYLLRLGDRELVLRRPPFGANIKSAHDMGREFRILSALHGVYAKVPRPLLYRDDLDVLGAPFYVMERVTGVILRARMAQADRPSPDRMAAVAEQLAATLAELHAVDYRAAGLDDLGRPEGYVGRQIAGWTKRYAHARTDDIPAMQEVADWLAANQPPEQGAALIHNDFKYDNVVLDPADGTRVVAVLDWEMATLGDPLMDLGTSLAYWSDPEDPPALRQLALSPTTLPGNPNRAAFAARYAAISGRDVSDLVFYYVYGLFKIAVIIQQIYARYQRGDTQDPRFAALGEGVRGCATIGTRAIAQNRIDHLF